MVHKLHGPHTALWLSGEVTIPWSVYTHCGRSTFVTTAAVSDYTYLSEFKREQTPWGAMNWFCAELMQHQLLRFGCWSTGTHNSEQKSLRVEWATLEFVPNDSSIHRLCAKSFGIHWCRRGGISMFLGSSNLVVSGDVNSRVYGLCKNDNSCLYQWRHRLLVINN